MTEKETWEAAAEEIRGWMGLNIKAHDTLPHSNPKEALREHKNQMNQLGVLLSKFLKNAGHDPKEIFKEIMRWSDDCGRGCKGVGSHYHDDRAMIETGSQPAEKK